MSAVIEVHDLQKSFGDTVVISDLNLKVEQGEMIAIQGKSGSGKSTLLNIIGTIEKPSGGTVKIFNQENVKPNSRISQNLLRNKIGYLFQNYALIDNETVESNLKVALYYNRKGTLTMEEALSLVGLSGYEKRKVFTLSGGEQQRISLARTLIKDCELILADEPTGNIDDENKRIIMDIFLKMKDMGKTIIIVTHDTSLNKYFDKIIHL